jgi:hypothetical protein
MFDHGTLNGPNGSDHRVRFEQDPIRKPVPVLRKRGRSGRDHACPPSSRTTEPGFDNQNEKTKEKYRVDSEQG